MSDRTYYHDIEVEAVKAVKEDVMAAMKVFTGRN